MKETTHREYLTWIVYLNGEWNNPSRTDHYLMLIATEVRRVLSKRPNSIKLPQFKLNFDDGIKEKKLSKKEASKISKARWFGSLGKNIIRKVIGKDNG